MTVGPGQSGEPIQVSQAEAQGAIFKIASSIVTRHKVNYSGNSKGNAKN